MSNPVGWKGGVPVGMGNPAEPGTELHPAVQYGYPAGQPRSGMEAGRKETRDELRASAGHLSQEVPKPQSCFCPGNSSTNGAHPVTVTREN